MSFGSSLANGTVSNAGGALEVVVAFPLSPVGELVAVEGTLDTTEVELPARYLTLAVEVSVEKDRREVRLAYQTSFEQIFCPTSEA